MAENKDTKTYLPDDIASKYAKPLAAMAGAWVKADTGNRADSARWYETLVCPIQRDKNDVVAAAIFNSALAAYGVAKLPMGFAKERGLPHRSTLGALLVLARTSEENQEKVTELLKAQGIRKTTKAARADKWIEPETPRKGKGDRPTDPNAQAPKAAGLADAGPVGSLDRLIAFLSNYAAVTFFPRGAVDYREVMNATPTPYGVAKSIVNVATVLVQTLQKLEADATILLKKEREALKHEQQA